MSTISMIIRRAVLTLLVTTSAACSTAFVQQTATQPGPYLKEFGTMWTFDAPPLDYWKRTYNFTPDQAWLDHVRLASVRLPGCSASFVSANGLVMTNHHCGRTCTAAVSPADTNYMTTGFSATVLADEKRCPGLYVDQLQSITNVTDKIRAAVTGMTPAEQAVQRKTVIDQLQQNCKDGADITCEVITLYQGGLYSLYRYKRFTDVRLVMAPEESIAFYGGDPDNFTYPRFDLDLTLLRVYQNDAPMKPEHYLKWSASGAAENELIFVIGNPGSTGRLLTVAQMEYLRDVQYPAQLAGYQQTLGLLNILAQKNGARAYENSIFSLQNSFKAVSGYRRGLTDSTIMARKRAFESDFRARIDANPSLKAQYGPTWDAVAEAQHDMVGLAAKQRFYDTGGNSAVMTMAIQLVRLPIETLKPDSLRLPSYRTANLERMRGNIGSTKVDTAFEHIVIRGQFTAAQQALPANDPFLTLALNGRTPDATAQWILANTQMADSSFRMRLLHGGAEAIKASTDPLIVFMRSLDTLNRGIAAQVAAVNAVITTNTEKIGQALFAAYGSNLPPDATFTLRITDGVAKGYPMNGTIAPYKTSFYGLFARAAEFDNQGPFALPPRWASHREKLDMTTPFNFVSTNDIIGGNSGSPVINRNAEVVGLIFDGNIESLPNRFLFTDEVARSVSVHSRAITEALRKVYDNARIADEIAGK